MEAFLYTFFGVPGGGVGEVVWCGVAFPVSSIVILEIEEYMLLIIIELWAYPHTLGKAYIDPGTGRVSDIRSLELCVRISFQ